MTVYEAPEVFELGKAEDVTLGSQVASSCDCEGKYRNPSE